MKKETRYYRQQKTFRDKAKQGSKERKKLLLDTLKETEKIKKENPNFKINTKDLKNEKVIKKVVGREKRRAEKSKRIRKKRELLSSLFDLSFLSDSKVDKITFKDIEENNFSIEKYRFLYDKSDGSLDFNRIYKTKNYFVFAYRDYKNESSISEHLDRFSRYSNDDLLEFLRWIVTKPLTAIQGKSGTSGGSAGEAVIKMGSAKMCESAIKEIKKKNARGSQAYDTFGNLMKHRQHSDFYAEFQFLRSNGDVIINEFTIRNLLIFCNAVMHNITELDRVSFYLEFYQYFTEQIPEMEKILPEPPIIYGM